MTQLNLCNTNICVKKTRGFQLQAGQQGSELLQPYLHIADDSFRAHSDQRMLLGPILISHARKNLFFGGVKEEGQIMFFFL